MAGNTELSTGHIIDRQARQKFTNEIKTLYVFADKKEQKVKHFRILNGLGISLIDFLDFFFYYQLLTISRIFYFFSDFSVHTFFTIKTKLI